MWKKMFSLITDDSLSRSQTTDFAFFGIQEAKKSHFILGGS